MDQIIVKLHEIIRKLPFIGKHISQQFMRFFVIGFSSFVIAYSINNILVFIFAGILNPNETLRAIIVAVSYIIGFIISFIFNFYFSRKWTFKSTSQNYQDQVSKFLAVNVFNAIAGALIISALDYIGIPPLISQPPIIAVQMFWSYFVYKIWVFKD
jgi:putative flippase GtrA